MTTYYLYVKTHNVTGLKYLGVTSKSNPHRYRGSGIQWTRHIKKYGYNVTTEILLMTTCPDILKLHGLYFSKKWNIVENKSWANLKEEAGIEGGHNYSEESRQKIRNANIGKKMHPNARKGLLEANVGRPSPLKGKPMSEETKNRLSETLNGRPKSTEHKEKLSKSLKGHVVSEETRAKMSAAKKNYIPWNKGLKFKK